MRSVHIRKQGLTTTGGRQNKWTNSAHGFTVQLHIGDMFFLILAPLPPSPCPSPAPPPRASSPCTSPPAKSLIFSMGRNPQYFHSEEILNIFNEEILTIVNRKKFSIFPMGRNPRYFQWEEILNIFNRKRGATHPKHTSHASFASPRHFSLHSHELLVFI